ncbi:MAG TPA: cytochrome c oxidase subunit II [Aromatoleum sp.]|uniref:cytochrome c oxidase subunit II n=1 Tax=Aromatoleum sp. TaxID=2307007 RepID=UPI002B49C5A5|nr:cytochrome c oxidase subunit II [Aromatoleum sp.]HJV26913.1 cytochrome c oxidase subunit II [Aromatoleum sp.]
MSAFELLPPAASTMAGRVDTIFLTLSALCGFVALAIAVLIVVFAIRYREGASVDRSNPPTRNRALEIGWIVVPLVIFAGIFLWAGADYAELRRQPADAMPIFVVAKQWMWKLEHEGGRREINELHVPVGRPVRLVMTSEDVIHSFFVPAFRIKQDVVPGRYSSLWFTATGPGNYHLFCAEYCGSQHAAMGGRIVAMAPADFARWLESGGPTSGIAARGFALFRRYGCSGCHDPRSTVHAPDLAGLLGRSVHLADGRSLVADEAYIRDSVLLPNRDVVAGFEPIMPSFVGQIAEDELMAIIEYIRSMPGA